jgi:hypothetical protein
LFFALQNSLIGQLISGFEKMEHSQAVETSASGKAKFPDGPWAKMIHSVFRGDYFWDDMLPPRQRPVPLDIFPAADITIDPQEIYRTDRVNILHLCRLLYDPSFIDLSDSSTQSRKSYTVSRWTLLQVFLSAAFEEVYKNPYLLHAWLP